MIKIVENLKSWLVFLSLISITNSRNQGFFKFWEEIGLAILKKLRKLPSISTMTLLSKGISLGRKFSPHTFSMNLFMSCLELRLVNKYLLKAIISHIHFHHLTPTHELCTQKFLKEDCKCKGPWMHTRMHLMNNFSFSYQIGICLMLLLQPPKPRCLILDWIKV